MPRLMSRPCGGRLLLLLLALLAAAAGAQTPSCGEHEYGHDGVCCAKCPAGQHVEEHCSKDQNTRCKDCPDGYYMSTFSKMKNCLQCKNCRVDMIMERNCSKTNDTKCVCPPGTRRDENSPEMCLPQSGVDPSMNQSSVDSHHGAATGAPGQAGSTDPTTTEGTGNGGYLVGWAVAGIVIGIVIGIVAAVIYVKCRCCRREGQGCAQLSGRPSALRDSRLWRCVTCLHTGAARKPSDPAAAAANGFGVHPANGVPARAEEQCTLLQVMSDRGPRPPADQPAVELLPLAQMPRVPEPHRVAACGT